MMWSPYVWGIAIFVTVPSILTGFYDGSTSGILEMDGFWAYFDILGNSSELATCSGSEEEGAELAREANYSQGVMADTKKSSCASSQSTDTGLIVGIIVSATCLGSAVGSLVAGWLADHCSRKYTLLIGGVIYGVGSLIMALAIHLALFVVGRTICGLGVGICYMVMSVYIAEMSPSTLRGALGAMIGPGYAGGFLLGHLLSVGLSRICIGWRVSIAIQALAGLVYGAGMKWLPHTPRYLVMVGREQEALNILHRINRSSGSESFVDTCFELEELKANCAAISKEANSKSCSKLRDLCQSKYLTRLLKVFMLFFLSAFMGTFIFFFIPTLFCQVGVGPFVSSLAVGSIMVVASIVLQFTIEKLGRKVSLLGGCGVNVIFAATVGVLSHEFGSSNTIVSYSIVIIISLYTFAYSYSWLSIVFVVASEVFPISIRGITMALSTFTYWMCIFVFGQVTPVIIASPMQVKGFFYLLSGVNFFAFIFTLLSLPETKGVSLEEMDSLFSQTCYAKSSVMKKSNSPEISTEQSEDIDIKIKDI